MQPPAAIARFPSGNNRHSRSIFSSNGEALRYCCRANTYPFNLVIRPDHPSTRCGVALGLVYSSGFALVSVLTILALLVVMVVSISTVLHVETRFAAVSKDMLVARQNALLGLDTAISQLQEYAGKDQAVTFPATTFYPTKDVNLAESGKAVTGAATSGSYGLYGTGDLFDNGTYGYRTLAVTSKTRSYLNKVGTYLTPTERVAWDAALKNYWNNVPSSGKAVVNPLNPHWTGVMDAALRVDRATQPGGIPTAIAAQRYENATPSSPTKFGEPKRDQIPVWLVSGNEKYTVDQSAGTITDSAGADAKKDYITPDKPLPDPATDSSVVYLVNLGSAADSTNSTDGIDGRVKVVKQPIRTTNPQGATSGTSGYYAYWVGDESTKANFASRDRTSTNDTAYPNDLSKSSKIYRNRLQVPQRIGWENIAGFSGTATFSKNDPNLENIATSKDIGLLEDTNTAAIKTAGKNNFHHLTAFSSSLLTDTALGGLKKDLTVFIQTGSGLADGDPIADRNLYLSNDSRFRAWGGVNNGFPSAAPPYNMQFSYGALPYSLPASLSGNPSIPTWGQLRSWYTNATDNDAAITPNADTAPVITYVMFHGGLSYDGASKKIRWHWLPCIVLWNPYSVPLQAATYDLQATITPNFNNLFVVKGTPSLAELQRDVGANWTGIEGDRSTYKYTAADNTIKSLLTGDPDANPAMANNSWPKSDLSLASSPGITDAFGRFFYKLTAANPVAPSSFSIGATTGPLGNKVFTVSFSPQSASGGSNAVPFRFQINAGFNAGEAKVFTIGSDFQWNPTDSSQKIPLSNTFVADQPASLWFEAFNVVNGPDSSSGNLQYNASLVASVVSPPIIFTINGKTIMETANGFGTIYGGGPAYSISGINYYSKAITPSTQQTDTNGNGVKDYFEPVPKFVSSWRPLYDFDKFSSNIKAQDTYNTSSSIWQFGRAWLQPLTSPGGQSQYNCTSYFPFFSRYNLSSKFWDFHPLVDMKRNANAGYNYRGDGNSSLEGLAKNLHVQSLGDSNFKTWDEDQSDGTAGYALITYRNPDNPFVGQSILPVRNARRVSSEVLSLGQFQQVNLSPYFWQPSFPIGNSFAAPYTDRESIAGLNSRGIGGEQGKMPGKVANDVNNTTMDLSYLLNENLWDRYFLSSIPQTETFSTTSPLANGRMRFRNDTVPSVTQARNFDTAAAYLYNFGALNVNSTSVEAWKSLLSAFRGLAFANNDTRSPSESGSSIVISRTLDPIQNQIGYTSGTMNAADIGAVASNKDYKTVLGGFRYLTDSMIQTLAERIVDEVRLRGPFLSLADFVNRRLAAPQGSNDQTSKWYDARTNAYVRLPHPLHNSYMDPAYDPFIGLQGLTGALERAIQLSGINGGVNNPGPTQNDRIYSINIKNSGGAAAKTSSNQWDTHYKNVPSDPVLRYNTYSTHTQEPAFRSHLDMEHIAAAPTGEAGQLFDGAPGFVTQGDLLSMIGSAITPRGDTFIVRAYGDTINKTGKVLARAYVEAVVQRVPDPVTPAGTSGEDQWRPTDKFGRKFKIIKLRWLNPEEI